MPEYLLSRKPTGDDCCLWQFTPLFIAIVGNGAMMVRSGNVVEPPEGNPESIMGFGAIFTAQRFLKLCFCTRPIGATQARLSGSQELLPGFHVILVKRL